MKSSKLKFLFVIIFTLILPLSIGSGSATENSQNMNLLDSEEAKSINSYQWELESVNASMSIGGGGNRTVVLDSFGYPHIVFGGTSLYYARYDGTQWLIELVDSSPSVGGMISIILDSMNHPHISYRATNYIDDLYWYLKYAYYDGVNWNIETIDSDGNVGYWNSIALDSYDHPHISYHHSPADTQLKYAYYDGTNWQIEIVDIGTDAGYWSSIDIDLFDLPHIAYYQQNVLKYASFDGTTWSKELVGTASSSYGSLALDASNLPHISYVSGLTLNYAYNNGDNWYIETVLSQGSNSSIAIDSQGNPHIVSGITYAHYNGITWSSMTFNSIGEYPSITLNNLDRPFIRYIDPVNTTVCLAKYDGTTWVTEIIAVGSRAGVMTSLVIDNNNYPHISYMDDTEDLWKYAHYNGISWQTEIIDDTGFIGNYLGNYSSLALDSFSLPYIVYINTMNFMKLAHFDSSSWNIDTLIDDGEVGNVVNLAIDSSDNPHIIYTNSLAQPMYKYYDGVNWHTSKVSEEQTVGYVSIALDSLNIPHLSFRNFSNANLRYAYLDGNSWILSTVDSQSDTGSHNSIAIDSNDNPHIAYCYSPSGEECSDVRYAHYEEDSWVLETIDTDGTVGQYTSLALDQNDNPYISYCIYDDTYNHCTDLKLAYYDGTEWIIEIVDSQWGAGRYASIDIGSNNLPGISYYNDVRAVLMYAHTVCVPLDSITISGPTELKVGEVGIYYALFTPSDATLPITYTWDNGTVSNIAAYSWPGPGTYTISVTAENYCGSVLGSLIGITVEEIPIFNIFLPLTIKY